MEASVRKEGLIDTLDRFANHLLIFLALSFFAVSGHFGSIFGN